MPPSELITEPPLSEQVQAFDWSASLLGRREDWPQRLRMVVSLALESRFPKLILWGGELVMIYNDSYRSLIGQKHPDALGRPAREMFPEVWSILGPMFERVQSEGHAIGGEDVEFALNRAGFVEEVYFNYSYSPIKDEAGVVRGILVTCFETTRKVVSERRMRVLSELATESAAAKTLTDACAGIARVFTAHPRPLPFALVYLWRAPEQAMELAVQSGLPAGHVAAPATLENSSASPWPFGRSQTRGHAVQFDDLDLGCVESAQGTPGETVRTALMFSLAVAGSAAPAGVFIVGVNPRTALDENYRRFLELVAHQVATAIANVRAQELERRGAEEMLRCANDTLETIFNAAPAAIIAVDLEGRVTNWSASAERMFGWTAKEAIGRISPVIPAGDMSEFRARLAEIARSKRMQAGVARWRRKKNGERFLASISAGPLTDIAGEPTGALAVVEDITEREAAREAIQQYSERLSRLSQQLIGAQEMERRRIARELHDEIGQSLTLVKLHLEVAKRVTSDAGVESLTRAQQGIERLLANVRQLCVQLRPALLDDLGLLPALLTHIERFNEQHHVRCAFLHEGIDAQRFPPVIETTVFRIVQEALTNVVRHSGAKEARVTIWSDPSVLQARVQDDGAGFQLETVLGNGASSGIAGMLERAKLAGGELRITTGPAAGTCLTLELPLQADNPS